MRQFTDVIVGATEAFTPLASTNFPHTLIPLWSVECLMGIRGCRQALQTFSLHHNEENWITPMVKGFCLAEWQVEKHSSWNHYVSSMTY